VIIMPFIQKIILDDWVGPRSNNQESRCASVDDAIEAISRLNGRNHTQAVLKGQDRTLLVGGGNDGRYSVVLTLGDDEVFYTLIDPESTAERDVVIITGGQAGKFPQNQSIGLTAVIKAVRDFFELGEPSPALVWKRE
jgi:hypothetical protein